MQAQIEESAYREARRQTSGESVVVGVNRYVTDEVASIPVLEVDAELETSQRERLARWRAERDEDVVQTALATVADFARGPENLLYPMKAALSAGATVGEVSRTLAGVFGRHRPTG
jgi:methylmalonyl-CoA mutase N-terminal domain/subunit